MDFVAAMLVIGAGAAAYLKVVWLSTESREIRISAIWALVGSLVLGLDFIFNSLCGLAENRSELFQERCEGSTPYIPLYVIPLLLAAPILRRFAPGGTVLMIGAVLVVTAILVPLQLLSV
jgi:hypothetical protein